MNPGNSIGIALGAALRELAPEAERLGKLHAGQLSIIYAQKWFNLYVPGEYGGLALSLPEGLEIEESLASADGSVGWTVTLCSGANWFVGFLKPETRKLLFGDSRVCLAGSGCPSGIARRTATGYRVTGNWNYATGSPHATAFTANCRIEEDGVILKNPDGTPLIQAFVFLKEEVRIENNWRVIGLVATASNHFTVEDLPVGEDRCFIIDGDHATLSDPIYQYPFLQLAETTLAVNSSGMAARFIELAGSENIAPRVEEASRVKEGGETIRPDRDRETGRLRQVRGAKKELERLRAEFYRAVQSSWEMHIKTPEEKDPLGFGMLLKEVSNASYNLATGARSLVDRLYPFCGVAAADPSTEINRVWRNLHTASQHTLLLEKAE